MHVIVSLLWFFFFFQAEDGIRDGHVTGVQTCALPSRKSVFFGYELKLLTSTAGGRFPRAWLEPPCASHSGVSRLMGLHYRSSHRRPFAIPAGQGRLRQRYIARRKSVCIFEESPPSVPISDAVLRIMNKLKRLWN